MSDEQALACLERCSDDLMYFNLARDAMFRDRSSQGNPHAHAYWARVFTIHSVAGVDATLEFWASKSRPDVLKTYFKERTSNRDRLADLAEGLLEAGVNVEPQVIMRYLAMKYVRNAVAHGGDLQPWEVEHCREVGFPETLNGFDERHRLIMYTVFVEMMSYLTQLDLGMLVNHGTVSLTWGPRPQQYL